MRKAGRGLDAARRVNRAPAPSKVTSDFGNEPMSRYEFHLHISSEAYLDYYRGTVHHVIVRCASGQTVQFPASLLQHFVTQEGIHGAFVLTCDENHKCVDLQRVPPHR
jgi:hypothetical protein